MRVVTLFLASYGMLYYSYKYFLPPLLNGDSKYYYPMYLSPLNLHAAQSPFVLRQIGALLTYIAWHAHIYYPNTISFQDPGTDQHVFFAALLINWICLVLTACVAGIIAEEFIPERNLPVALIASLLCLLTFHAQVAIITDLAEGPAWLLLSLTFLSYVRESRLWVIVLLVLSIFQREMILLAMGFIAALEFWPRKSRRSNALSTFCSALFCFVIYLILRRYLGGGWEFQSHPLSLLKGLSDTKFSVDLLFQGFLAQNILFISILAFAMAHGRPDSVRHWMPKLISTFLFLALVSLGSYEGNTMGRLAGILTPIFAALAAVSLCSLQHSSRKSSLLVPLTRGTNRSAALFLAATLLLVPCIKIFHVLHPKHKRFAAHKMQNSQSTSPSVQ